MRTKKSKIRNRKTRIKGGSMRGVLRDVGREENKIVSQMEEINVHLSQITNAIRACCNHENVSELNNEDANESSASTPYRPMPLNNQHSRSSRSSRSSHSSRSPPLPPSPP